ncbi:hypothetical protein [Kozakia baliensis]|uniref:hypothetical protein n=1 Tax=Kozakia baliensis TaxID=153496 RepID=UPI000497869C|nr:hypothetical protein [Kozakia baliensis]AOX19369.1 hypothetical protein A0U90_02630 [Kozakia baliensis]
MRKETLLVVGFLAIVIGTSALIWSFALPNFRPIHFPKAASATISIGPMRKLHTLNEADLASLNEWLQNHEHGWGPLTTKTPSTGDAIINVAPEQGEPYSLTLWNGVSGADWNETVILHFAPDTPFKIQSFDSKEYLPLRRLIEDQPYQRTDVP